MSLSRHNDTLICDLSIGADTHNRARWRRSGCCGESGPAATQLRPVASCHERLTARQGIVMPSLPSGRSAAARAGFTRSARSPAARCTPGRRPARLRRVALDLGCVDDVEEDRAERHRHGPGVETDEKGPGLPHTARCQSRPACLPGAGRRWTRSRRSLRRCAPGLRPGSRARLPAAA